MPLSLLDEQQIIKDVHDEGAHALRTTATLVADSIDLAIDQASDSIAIGDGSRLYTGTTTGPDYGLDVNVLNQLDIAPSGLSHGLKSIRIIVTDTPLAIPTNIVSPQNGLSLRVLGTSTVYIGNASNTFADGYPKFQFEELTVDITAAVSMYLVCDPGKSCEVAILAVG